MLPVVRRASIREEEGAREGDAAGAEADVAMFTQAQRKLRFNFRVVGLSERPEDTLRLLRAAFGWLDSSACVPRSASLPSSKDEALSLIHI